MRKSIRNCSAKEKETGSKEAELMQLMEDAKAAEAEKNEQQLQEAPEYTDVGTYQDIGSVRAMNLWQPGSGNMSRSPNCFRSIR